MRTNKKNKKLNFLCMSYLYYKNTRLSWEFLSETFQKHATHLPHNGEFMWKLQKVIYISVMENLKYSKNS